MAVGGMRIRKQVVSGRRLSTVGGRSVRAVCDAFVARSSLLGHALGLAHSAEKGAIMGPIYEQLTEAKLHEDDIEAIQLLYGKPLSTTPTQRTTVNRSPGLQCLCV